MKRIAWPYPVENSLRRRARRPAAALAFWALCAIGPRVSTPASTRPKAGGTLRVELAGRVENLDPRQPQANDSAAAAAERVQSLVFDRLVRLDEHGTLQPALAISWQHDAPAKRWDFRLRDGVKFSDGTP